MLHPLPFAVLIALVATSGCGHDPVAEPTADLESRRQHILDMEDNVSEEAVSRKQRSITVLKRARVPFIEHLPVIETEEQSKRRSTDEVARRAMALCIVAVKGEGLEQENVDELVAQYQLADAFTPKELAFIHDPNPTQHDRIQFAWRYEGYWVLLWALGFVESLDPPGSICDVPKAVRILRDHGREGFMEQADLRPQREILDAADLIYRYHWAVVQARVSGSAPPEGLDGGVVLERHYVLNWLIGYMDQDWDDISTDT